MQSLAIFRVLEFPPASFSLLSLLAAVVQPPQGSHLSHPPAPGAGRGEVVFVRGGAHGKGVPLEERKLEEPVRRRGVGTTNHVQGQNSFGLATHLQVQDPTTLSDLMSIPWVLFTL